MSKIEIKNIHKSFFTSSISRHAGVTIFEDFSLSADSGEFLAVFGPNGCGKSTLLKIIAGLVEPDKGSVSIGGMNPGEAKVGFIFQNYRDSLLPWRNCLDNITFPLELQGFSKRDRINQGENLLEKLEISLPLQSYTYELSGGQQQLVAIAQALIREPDVLLLDEPFSALDFQTRLFMQDKFLDLWERTGVTVIFVSHEIDEAAYLSDRIVLLTKKPMRVLRELDNPIARPRNRQSRKSEEFFQVVNSALEIFEKHISNE